MARARLLRIASAPPPIEDIIGDAESDVIPGVKWGRPEWVPSAAFWASMVSFATEEGDGYVVDRSTPLSEEVGFCLLGGYGITAEMNLAAHQRLRDNGIYERGRNPTSAEIERCLTEPLLIDGRMRRYRFPSQRSVRLACAIAKLEKAPPDASDALEFRRQLMSLPGIGPKTASWITRNWLGSDQVAILDIHIVRAGLVIGLFDHRMRLPNDYGVMETRFLAFAAAIGAKPSLLDAVMWKTMRNIRYPG